ncbi:MAG: hypothetical protein EXS36_12430 [Pedosphaera sp.]|nr:hypothetical protein [Pedosphaera sp.]
MLAGGKGFKRTAIIRRKRFLMPTTVTCQCGAQYTLKDEFAGRTVQCPQCRQPIQVGGPNTAGSSITPTGGIFDRD